MESPSSDLDDSGVRASMVQLQIGAQSKIQSITNTKYPSFHDAIGAAESDGHLDREQCEVLRGIAKCCEV